MFDGLDLDVVERFGHPWHGSVNHATGTLTSNGGVVVPRPGLLPSAGNIGRHQGKVMTVQVPGHSPITQTPAELAAGVQWLHYAILAGESQNLYGKPLGNLVWLYVAPDNTVWRAQVFFLNMSNVTTPQATVDVRVNLARFGVIGGAASGQVIDNNGVVLPFSIPSGSSGVQTLSGGDVVYDLLDATTSGNKALFQLSRRVFHGGEWVHLPYWFVEVTIAGTPTGATASVSVLHNPATIYQQTVTAPTGGVPIVDVYNIDGLGNYGASPIYSGLESGAPAGGKFLQSLSIASTSSMITGLHYSTVNALITCRVDMAWQVTQSGTVSTSGPNYTVSQSSSESGSVTLMRNGAAVDSISYSMTASVSGTGPGVPGNASGTFDGEAISHSWVNGSNAVALVYGSIVGAGLGTGLQYSDGVSTRRASAFRYTPTIHGLRRVVGAATTLKGAYGKWASDATNRTDAAVYATENPVTGLLQRATNPISTV